MCSNRHRTLIYCDRRTSGNSIHTISDIFKNRNLTRDAREQTDVWRLLMTAFSFIWKKMGGVKSVVSCSIGFCKKKKLLSVSIKNGRAHTL